MEDKSKFRIAVVGVGGVGGYVGGKLAAAYEGSEEVEVVLAARGENERAIRAGGLKIIDARGGEQTVRPNLVGAAAEIFTKMFPSVFSIACCKLPTNYGPETETPNFRFGGDDLSEPCRPGFASQTRLQVRLATRPGR